jgi:hypothetical protein
LRIENIKKINSAIMFYFILAVGFKSLSTVARAVCSSAAAKFIINHAILFAAATTAHPAACQPKIFFQLLSNK